MEGSYRQRQLDGRQSDRLAEHEVTKVAANKGLKKITVDVKGEI